MVMFGLAQKKGRSASALTFSLHIQVWTTTVDVCIGEIVINSISRSRSPLRP